MIMANNSEKKTNWVVYRKFARGKLKKNCIKNNMQTMIISSKIGQNENSAALTVIFLDDIVQQETGNKREIDLPGTHGKSIRL